MTADHLMPSGILRELFALTSSLAKGDVPLEVVRCVRMGRITALRKEDVGVRGITVGDILRRLVARTITQQISKVMEESTAPYQHVLSTKVGCECVAHIVQVLTDSDESATVVSVDGIGAFDLIVARGRYFVHELTSEVKSRLRCVAMILAMPETRTAVHVRVGCGR